MGTQGEMKFQVILPKSFKRNWIGYRMKFNGLGAKGIESTDDFQILLWQVSRKI